MNAWNDGNVVVLFVGFLNDEMIERNCLWYLNRLERRAGAGDSPVGETGRHVLE